MTDLPQGAHVEIVDDDPHADFLLPKRVLVNGHDLGLIVDGGVKIDPGDNNTIATVTITLIPRRIEIRPASDTPRTIDVAADEAKGGHIPVAPYVPRPGYQDPHTQAVARIAEGGEVG